MVSTRRHQRERVALGEVQRPHQPRPDPLGAFPLDAIAVMPPDRHQLLAQEAIDRHGARRPCGAATTRLTTTRLAPSVRVERAVLLGLRWGRPAAARVSACSTASSRSPASSPSRTSSPTLNGLVARALRPGRGLGVNLSRPPQDEVDFPARQLVGRHDTFQYSAPARRRITGMSRERIGNAEPHEPARIAGRDERAQPAAGERRRPNRPAQPRIGRWWRRVR